MERRGTQPPIRATVTAIKGQRVRVVYTDTEGRTVRRLREACALRRVTVLAAQECG